jgi:hypothetical protein
VRTPHGTADREGIDMTEPTAREWLEQAADRFLRDEPNELPSGVCDVRAEYNDPDPANITHLVDRRTGWTFTAELTNGEEITTWRP